MRFLYSLLVHAAVPFVFGWQLARGLRDPAYRDRPLQRFGFVPTLRGGALWVHAVSVGEVRAAAILVPQLARRWPDRHIVVTTATPTGARQVSELMPSVTHCYLPYDLPGAVRRFLDRVRPQAGIVMETEIWPTLFTACSRRGIPLVIASARLSPRSVRRYRRVAGLLRDVFAGDVTVAAQSPTDAARYREIGADASRVQVGGNLKFDLAIPDSVRDAAVPLRQALGADRPVWIAGSTRDGEEALLVEAHRKLLEAWPRALLVIVPRHPARFAEVRALLAGLGIALVTRSSGAPVTAATEVLLVDTLGELLGFYAAADVAFVGGSLVPVGGHNLLEPAALGKPVLTGPHVFNAPDVARLLVAAGAAVTVHDAGEVASAVGRLFGDAAECRRSGEAGLAVVAGNRGAVERIVDLVAARLAARQRG